MVSSKLYVGISVLSLILFTSLAATPSFASTPIFVPAYNLSNDSGVAHFPMVASSGSNVYVTWTEGSNGIFFRANSQDGLQSAWSPPLASQALKISTGSGVSNYPVIQANGSNVYISWTQSISGKLQIMFVYSHNYGVNFSSPIQITHASVASITPVLAGYGSDVYITYASGSYGSLVNSSTDGGVTWTNPGTKIATAHEPQLAAWGSNAYAVSDGSLYVSNNNGKTWSRPYLAGYIGSEPWIAASGTNVFVAWETKGRQSAVYAIYSTNNGSTWSKNILLSAHYPDSWAPMVSAEGNTVFVAFHTKPGSIGAREYIVTSSNYFATNTTKLLSAPRQDASWPFNIAVSGSDVFVMWGQRANSTTWNAMVAYSVNGGMTWPKSPPAIDASNNGRNSQISPENDIATGSIASSGPNAFLAWQNASASASYSQIYFTSS